MYLKNGVLKSIAYVIKHADFQLYSYLENLEIGDKFVHKRVRFFIY